METRSKRGVCRLCHKDSNKVVQIYNDLKFGNDLGDKINLHLPVKVDKNDTSSLCCVNCAKTVLDFHELVRKCHKTEERLERLRENIEINIDSSLIEINCEDKESDSDLHKDVNISTKFTCTLCNKSFLRKCSLQIHMIRHQIRSKRKEYLSYNKRPSTNNVEISEIVNDIMARFNINNSLKVRDLKKSCLICKEMFSNSYCLIIHQYRHHRLDSKLRSDSIKNVCIKPLNLLPNIKSDCNICSICCLTCKDKVALLSHRERYHPTGALTSLSCQTCTKQFSTPKDFRHHNKVAHKPFVPRTKIHKAEEIEILDKLRFTDNFGTVRYKCDICGSVIKRPYQTLDHYDRHKGNFRFCCEHCGQKFTNPFGLQNHLQKHTGIRTEVCSICNAKFYDKRILKNHMAVHDDVAKYVCEVCGKGFKQIANYYVHKRHHSNDTFTHVCQFCGKKFRVSSRLKTHIWTHTGEKPYDCQVCAKTFRLRKTLKKHMRVHKGFEDVVIPVKRGVYARTKTTGIMAEGKHQG